MKVNKEYIERLFSDIIDENIFIKGVISSPVNKEYPYSKINIKPLKIKDEIFIQFEQYKIGSDGRKGRSFQAELRQVQTDK